MGELKVVATKGAPAAIGPYSQAVVCGGMVYCSGQIAMDPATGEIVGTDCKSQTKQVIKNLEAVLKEAGSSLQSTVKLTVFLKDLGDFSAMNEVYSAAMGGHRPARAAVEVSRLPRDVIVEIDAIALVTR